MENLRENSLQKLVNYKLLFPTDNFWFVTKNVFVVDDVNELNKKNARVGSE